MFFVADFVLLPFPGKLLINKHSQSLFNGVFLYPLLTLVFLNVSRRVENVFFDDFHIITLDNWSVVACIPVTWIIPENILEAEEFFTVDRSTSDTTIAF